MMKMGKKVYFYTDADFAEYIRKQCDSMRKNHGISLSTADMSKLLYKKVILPNNISITDTIRPREINIKWKKLRLKL